MPDRSRVEIILEELRLALEGVEAGELDEFAGALARARRLFLAGAGRTGLVMRMLAMRLMQAGLEVHIAGAATTPACGAGDLLVVGSGSGETAGMRLLADEAAEAGAEVALLTRAPGSALEGLAGRTLRLPVPLEPEAPGGLASTQPLGTLFEQALLLACDLLVERVMARTGATPQDLQARHANLE
jgi:6-phospho-3-hexuloisomerase